MHMAAPSGFKDAALVAASSTVSDADIDALAQRNFLDGIALTQSTNIVPFALIGLCTLALPDPRLMTVLLAMNVAIIAVMYLISQRMRRLAEPQKAVSLWRVYDGFALLSGIGWAAMMMPVVTTLGRDIASMFVCVVIIVSVAVTCMVVAAQWRATLLFMIGVMLCLVPQTIWYMDQIGPIPLLATLGLGPTLYGLAYAVRKQTRSVLRTQLEKDQLAEELAHALAAAEYLANRDSLTGLYNRRAFETVATAMQNDASTAPLSLILVDLDHFKAINDRHGHSTGDSVLRRAADVIASHAGPLDLVGRGDGAVARWGGEEFIILLRNMSAADAAAVAERMRVDLTQLGDGSWPDGFMVTASFGVAEWSNGISLHTCISRSDEAMYSAKQAGRNRVRLHGAETNPEEYVAI